MSSQVREVNWSELQRDPKGVAELADAGDVRVIRRDGANLLLIREDRAASSGAGAVTAARALRQIVGYLEANAHNKVGRALAQEFPWLRFLPDDDLAAFANDFVDAAMAAAELARWELIDQVMHEWRATAAIHADPVLAQELTKPIVDEPRTGAITDGRGVTPCRRARVTGSLRPTGPADG